MVMDTIQIRINKELIRIMDNLIEKGIYSNRAEIIRDAVRRFVWEKEAGSITNNHQDSVKEIKEAREILSKNINLNEINSL